MYSSDPKSTYPASEYPSTGIPVSASNSYYSDSSYNQSQPGPLPLRPRAPVPWSTGLWDCFTDVRNCELIFIKTTSFRLKKLYQMQNQQSNSIYIFLFSLKGCITCWCPCITFGQIAEIVDKGSTCK